MSEISKRLFRAKFGSPSVHEKIITSGTNLDKVTLAKHGSDEIHTRLMHDPDPDVRADVAYYGGDHHRDHLVNDTHPKVRMTIATCGHSRKRHIEKLLDDPDDKVRSFAQRNVHRAR